MRREQKNSGPVARLCYPYHSIWTMSDLFKLLGVKQNQLINIAENANNLYISQKPELKPDGTYRYTFNAKQSLKTIQNNIKNKILRKVSWPRYLQGSIKDKNNPRSYISNAQIHAGNNIIIRADISKFFPTTKASLFFDIWKFLLVVRKKYQLV